MTEPALTSPAAQAHAAEGGKAAARLEKAERAIEAERATVRQLQAALHAARARPVRAPKQTPRSTQHGFFDTTPYFDVETACMHVMVDQHEAQTDVILL